MLVATSSINPSIPGKSTQSKIEFEHDDTAASTSIGVYSTKSFELKPVLLELFE